MSTKNKSLISLLSTVFLFSLVVIVARNAVAEIPQMYVLFIRMFIASLCFLPFFILQKPWKKKNFPKLVHMSLLSSVNLVFFMWGIKYTSASASQLIYAAQPLLTVILTTVFMKTKYSATTLAGVLLGFAGLITVIFDSSVENGQTISGTFRGNFFIFIAMTGWFLYILLSRKFSSSFSPFEIGGTSIFVSFLIALILSVLQYYSSGIPPVFSQNFILSGLYLGVFGSFLTYVLMQYSIRNLSTLTVNLTSYLQPVVTTVLAVFLLHEKVTPVFFIGSVCVLAGVFMTATLELVSGKSR